MFGVFSLIRYAQAVYVSQIYRDKKSFFRDSGYSNLFTPVTVMCIYVCALDSSNPGETFLQVLKEMKRGKCITEG